MRSLRLAFVLALTLVTGCAAEPEESYGTSSAGLTIDQQHALSARQSTRTLHTTVGAGAATLKSELDQKALARVGARIDELTDATDALARAVGLTGGARPQALHGLRYGAEDTASPATWWEVVAQKAAEVQSEVSTWAADVQAAQAIGAQMAAEKQKDEADRRKVMMELERRVDDIDDVVRSRQVSR